jgi:ribosomal protein L14E/L6E/L27E
MYNYIVTIILFRKGYLIMTKKLLISVAAATILATGFTGCTGTGPDAPKHKAQDISKIQPIKIEIPIPGIEDVNEKLKYLGMAYKLSAIAYNATFASEDINALMAKNAEKIEKLAEKIAEKPETEQEKELMALANKLKETPEFKKAKKELAQKYAKAQEELKKMGIDALKQFILSKLNKDAVMGNDKVAQMDMMAKLNIGKELLKIPAVLEQIANTTKNLADITVKGATETYKAGEDASMFIQNELTNAMAEDLSEAESVDQANG